MSDAIRANNARLEELTQRWLVAFTANDWQTADQISREMDAIESETAMLIDKLKGVP